MLSVFSDTFPSTAYNTSNWASFDATIDDVGMSEPSASYSARFNGNPDGSDQIVSRVIDLSGHSDATLSYYYQQTGGGESPDSGEDLVVEYYNGSAWVELERQLGSDGDMTTYTQSNIVLPSAALHSSFQFRFTATGTSSTTSTWDDWFVDDVELDGNTSTLDAPVMTAEPATTPGTSNTVSWSTVADADEYYVEYDTSSSFLSPDGNSGWISGTSHEFTGLTVGETYYYRVKARDNGGTTTGSWSQTTQAEFSTGTLTNTTATAGGDVTLTSGTGSEITGRITNPGFETSGSWSYYETNTGYWYYLPDTTPDWHTEGSCSLYAYNSWRDSFAQGDYLKLTQNVDLTGVDTIKFDVKVDTSGVSVGTFEISVMIDGVEKWSRTTYDEYYDQEIDVSGLSGSHELEIHQEALVAYGGGSCVWSWWDNFRTYAGAGYDTSGTIVSPTITPTTLDHWGTLDFTKSTPTDTTLTVDVLNSSNTVLASDVAVGADLDTLGITASSIKLRGNLGTTNTSVTPSLSDWAVGWYETGSTLVESDWSNVVQSQQVDVTDSYIEGYKWNDLDGNGDWDTNEPGLPGWTIYVDEDMDGEWDGVGVEDYYATTGADGSYSIGPIPAGTYVVGEVQQSGWTQTFPGTGSDTTPPTVTDRNPAPDATVTAPALNVDVTFSEPVQGVEAADLVLSGTAAVSAAVGTPSNQGGNIWRFPVTGLVEGDLTLNLAPDPDDIEDLAGNDLASLSWSYTVGAAGSFRLLGGTGSEGTNPFSLVELQTAPVAEVLIGASTYNSAMDIDPASGILYSVGPSTLHMVDTADGSYTTVGTIQDGSDSISMRGIAFSPGGMLYGLSFSPTRLFTINKATGFATEVGPVSSSAWGIDFAPDGTLYAAYSSLYTLDPATGATLSTIGSLGNTVLDIDYAPDGSIYGVYYDTSELFQITPSNASTTLIGTYSSEMWGVASESLSASAPSLGAMVTDNDVTDGLQDAHDLEAQMIAECAAAVSGTASSFDWSDVQIIASPPTPPAGYVRSVADVTSVSAVMLSDVPTSTWTYGCSATSAGMIFGYYDRTGYPDMYTGSTNGGVAPLTDLGQGDDPANPISGACSIIATMNGFDGRSTSGHVDDYWISYSSTGPDPWEGSWTEHSWESCTADFMGTNQWKWDLNGAGTIEFNVDGGTALWLPSDGSRNDDWIPPASAGLPQTALTHGVRLFAESRGYTVLENFSQKTDNQNANGFSFADYMAEINAGCPVMIQVTGHSMVGVGYDSASQTVYLHDTWDNSVHSMPWGGSYSGMTMQGVTVIHLAPSANLPGTHQVELAPGQTVPDINFGNQGDELDYGDASDPTYPTLNASNGARHVVGNLYLGASVDIDADGQPNATATGDDIDGNDDEDGVLFTSGLYIGGTTTVDVTASATGKLDAWIDFNGDGDWTDAGEQIFTSEPLAAGLNSLGFSVPADAQCQNETFARFRVSSAGGLSFEGLAPDGEVEDYSVSIELAAPVLTPEPTITPDTENTIYWEAVIGADEYFAEYDDNFDFSSPDGNSGWITATEHTFAGLTPGRPYYYRVKARQVIPGSTGSWMQTSETDFGSDVLSGTSATTQPGDVVLAGGTGGSGGDVLWDLTHGVGEDLQPSGEYSNLVARLAGSGYTVTTTTAGLANLDLSPYEVIVVNLGSAWNSQYTTAEVAAVETFVQGGGGVLIQGDAAGLANSNVNPIAQAFGSTVGVSTLSPTDLYVSNFAAHPVFSGISQIGCIYAGEVTASSPSALVAFEPGGKGVATAAEVAAGRVVALGDLNLWANGYLTRSDNALFADNVFSWLSENSGYVPSGTVVSTEISPASLEEWGTLVFSETEDADTTLTVDVLPPTGSTPITGYEDVTSGTDLSGITYTTIRLQANLSTTNTSATPSLHDWTVNWQETADVYCESDWSDVESSVQGGMDFGDAPEGVLAYPSLGTMGNFPTLINTGPSGWVQHTNFGAWFGPLVDFEPDGNAGIPFPPYDQDETFQDGDAGLILPDPYTIQVIPPATVVPLAAAPGKPFLGTPGQTAVWGTDVDIDVHNTMPNETVGYVNVLMDWNQNGVWGDAGEHVLVDFPVPNPYNGPLSALAPPNFTIGPNSGYVWTRFTISERQVVSGWDGTGSFEDGESEDYLLEVDQLRDWGDAQDSLQTPAYPTLAAHNGANHVIAGPWLGTQTDNRDPEPDGQPNAAATGDDTDGNDDEDGIVFASSMTVHGTQSRNGTVTVTMNGSASALLDAWIDFNQDNVWQATEQLFGGTIAVNTGPNVLNFAIPAGALDGTTVARFRLSSAGGLGPVGAALDGEVEDHLVTFLPEFTIDNVSTLEGDGIGTTPFVFNVTRSATNTAVSVDVATANGTATAGSDYTAVSIAPLNFPKGVATLPVTVNVMRDDTVEADEIFTVNLSNPIGAVIVTGQGTGTITNDDSATLTVGDVTQNEDAGVMTFTVTLDNAVQGGLTVDYATSDGSALTSDSDYTAAAGTLTFSGTAGETQTFTVPITADTKVEANETFTVTLSNAAALGTGVPGGTGTITGTDTATGTIVNDDTATYDDIVGRASSSGDWFVAKSDGTSFANEHWGKWTTAVTWSNVLVGDFTGDGKDDVVGRADSTGDWFVAKATDSGFVTEHWGKWTTAVTWDNIMVGDFNGDGKDDLVGRAASSGDWFVGRSTGTGFAMEHWGKWTTAVNWNHIQVGDFNGDGYDDLVGRAPSSGDWFVAKSSSTNFATEHWGKWTTAVTWSSVLVGDFNGDGKDDVVGRADSSGDWFTSRSTGSSFAFEHWGKWTTAVNWDNIMVGDFNGDGYDDLIGRAPSSGDWFVARSSSTSFAMEHWGKWTTAVNWSPILTGDFTGDGKDDLAARADSSGDWFVSRSTGTSLVFEHWGRWTTSVPWVDIQVGDFDGAGGTSGGSDSSASPAAADFFWSEVGDTDDEDDSLLVENQIVDLLKMSE